MKISIPFFLVFLMLGTRTWSQTSENPNFQEDLAHKWKADEYGMKSYILVLLTSGEYNGTPNLEDRNAAFRGHMENIQRLAMEGKLLVAGPLDDNPDGLEGIFILNLPSVDSANQILMTDPAIKGGYLAYKAYPWYGSAALGAYLEVHDKIWRKKP